MCEIKAGKKREEGGQRAGCVRERIEKKEKCCFYYYLYKNVSVAKITQVFWKK